MKKIYFLLLSILFIVSCGGINRYYYKLENNLIKNKFDQAQELIVSSKDSYGDKNEFLYYLDLGFIEHL
ncbi:MAG: hypothetical protein II816_07115, partial [Elusimicrobia bacterium]|nr:hypothetical protein [Elusimicrobiota bacterium]